MFRAEAWIPAEAAVAAKRTVPSVCATPIASLGLKGIQVMTMMRQIQGRNTVQSKFLRVVVFANDPLKCGERLSDGGQ